MFDLTGQVAVITGGGGALATAMGAALVRAGVRIAVLDLRAESAERQAAALMAMGGEAIAMATDVLDEASLRAARATVLARWGRIDILLNAAGGNMPRASTHGKSPFTLPVDALDEVMRLNFNGTVIPTMVFGEHMAEQKKGCIVNISSMSVSRMLSGIPGYSAAKAAMENYTKWLAVDVARRFGEGLRVNAVSPGFFVGAQNRALLLKEDGSPTERGATILGQTPMGRFGRHDELGGIVVFLCSDAASFITGVVIPVDGGFSVASGI